MENTYTVNLTGRFAAGAAQTPHSSQRTCFDSADTTKNTVTQDVTLAMSKA